METTNQEMLGEYRCRLEAKTAIDPRGAQAMALFLQLDERGKKTALAMLAVAVKLHSSAECMPTGQVA